MYALRVRQYSVHIICFWPLQYPVTSAFIRTFSDRSEKKQQLENSPNSFHHFFSYRNVCVALRRPSHLLLHKLFVNLMHNFKWTLNRLSLCVCVYSFGCNSLDVSFVLLFCVLKFGFSATRRHNTPFCQWTHKICTWWVVWCASCVQWRNESVQEKEQG